LHESQQAFLDRIERGEKRLRSKGWILGASLVAAGLAICALLLIPTNVSFADGTIESVQMHPSDYENVPVAQVRLEDSRRVSASLPQGALPPVGAHVRLSAAKTLVGAVRYRVLSFK
jgi:hypothetical protein